MLEIKVPARELFKESTGEFIEIPEATLKLEHSLISLSKWESEIEKPFLSTKQTKNSMLYYIECMSLDKNINRNVINTLPDDVYSKITEYINKPMTATTINDMSSGINRDIITSEIIYYWMIKLGIPFECQKWHLNRLIMLIRVCSVKDGPQKKMSKKDIYAQNRALNEARKARMKTKG